MRRVVITGMGTVNPLGKNVEEFWENIKANKNGLSYVDQFDTENFPVKIVGAVKDFDCTEYIDKKEAKRMDRFTQFAVCSAKQALKMAGSDFKDVDPFKAGVIIGVGIGGLNMTEKEVTKFNEKPDKVSVFFIPMMIGNMAAGTVAIRTGFKGINYCTVSACASGTHAIGEAFHAIKNGYMDVAIAGGTEKCSIGFAYAGFNNMHAVTKSTDVDRASIPFDAERSGFVLGDGSGIVILEEYEHAKARGANIYAEVIGYGATCDAYHETSPDPEGKGGAKAMEFAVKESGRAPETFNYVNAHGTSTPMNDKTETAAVKLVFGEHAKNMVINSTKSMTGHLLGAAGGVEAVACALQIKNSKVHRTLGLKVADPECDLDYAADGTRDMKITGALSNSLGFGGHNACIAFAPVED